LALAPDIIRKPHDASEVRKSYDAEENAFTDSVPVSSAGTRKHNAPTPLNQVIDFLRPGRGQEEILEKILKLRIPVSDEYTDLPQLVVVGDQSSGKSSVLEALTGIRFPRGSNMFTEFGTQVSLLLRAARPSFARSLKLQKSIRRNLNFETVERVSKIKRGLSGFINSTRVSAIADTGSAQNVISAAYVSKLRL
jgi:hypothetical protein